MDILVEVETLWLAQPTPLVRYALTQSVSVQGLSLSTYAPNVGNFIVQYPTVQPLALALQTPSVIFAASVTTVVSGLSLAPLAPSIVVRVPIGDDASGYLQDYYPRVVVVVQIAAGVKALSLSLPVPAVRVSKAITVAIQPLSLAAMPPTVLRKTRITPDAVAAALAQYTPSLAYSQHYDTAIIAIDCTAVFEFPDNILSGTATIAIDCTAAFVLERHGETDPESRAESLGYRPSTPVLIAGINLRTIAELDAIPDNYSFLVDAAFPNDPADLFYQEGARASYIGTKVRLPNPGVIYVFRPGVPNEVVWYVTPTGENVYVDGELIPDYVDHGLYRYYADLGVWRPYTSLPERSIRDQQAFDILDRDRVVHYFARILGGMLGQYAYEQAKLQDAFSPEDCPKELLPALGFQYGVSVTFTDDEQAQRQAIRDAMSIARYRCQDDGIYLILRSLGFRGHATEIWTDPEATTNWTDESQAPPVGPPTSPQFRDAAGALTVTVRNVLDATRARTFAWDGQKGHTTFEAPHGYFRHDPRAAGDLEGYYPTSRVCLHVNNADRTPLSRTDSDATIAALKERIAEAVVRTGLLAMSDIRWFSTDIPAGKESLGVTDTLTVTRV